MKKILVFLFLAVVVAGCHNGSDTVYVDGVDNGVYDDVGETCSGCVVADDVVGTAVDNNGNQRDLTVETSKYVIKMLGQPQKKYKYYVWTGDKDTSTTDPDIIVDKGAVMVRKAE